MVASQVMRLDLSDYHGTTGADEQRLENKIVGKQPLTKPAGFYPID